MEMESEPTISMLTTILEPTISMPNVRMSKKDNNIGTDVFDADRVDVEEEGSNDENGEYNEIGDCPTITKLGRTVKFIRLEDYMYPPWKKTEEEGSYRRRRKILKKELRRLLTAKF